ncbi:hypothetical protein DH2020_036398 [Rehmannia glutinosa]|uniref:Uncharacterized protein n=1 Tax=Rehmannia glutinosa TaxID=99300 RepID=A0ABR0V753_REHGL
MKSWIGALLLVALVLSSGFIESIANYFCDSKCEVRCSKASLKERCLKYCGICCEICRCVPPGTYGNKDSCPCYKELKNSKGKPKCP